MQFIAISTPVCNKIKIKPIRYQMTLAEKYE